MTKKKSETYTGIWPELKADIDGLSGENRAQFVDGFRKLLPSIDQAMSTLKAWEAEADALFQVMGGHKSLPEMENYIRSNPPSAGAIAFLFDRYKIEVARNNQKKGYAAKAKAKKFVQDEWDKHREAYNNNKSAFARDYSSRVKREMGISITEKTIREDWLD